MLFMSISAVPAHRDQSFEVSISFFSTPFTRTWKSKTNILSRGLFPHHPRIPPLPHAFRPVQELRIADYIKAYMTTGRPPAPVPQEPADPTARASLELPPLFQPHVDLEKTSGGGALTERTATPSNVNGVSQSQDSEVAGLEAINAEEPFRGFSFEVSFFLPSRLRWPFVSRSSETGLSLPFLSFIRAPFIPKVTIFGFRS